MNGEYATNHTGGYLPFVVDVTKLLLYGQKNFVTVALNNTLDNESIPQGTIHYPTDRSRYPEGFAIQGYNFDYFNFAGIHRPVYLFTTPSSYIDDITVVTDFVDKTNLTTGIISYSVKIRPSFPYQHISKDNLRSDNALDCLIAVRDKEQRKVGISEGCSGEIQITNAMLWWPYLSAPKNENPGYMYTLEVYLTSQKKTFEGDVYRLKFGIRTAEVVNDTFLINKKPFYFRGFGRHEDYSVIYFLLKIIAPRTY